MKSKNPRLKAEAYAVAYAVVTAAHAKAAVMSINDGDEFMKAAHQKFQDVLVGHADDAADAADKYRN